MKYKKQIVTGALAFSLLIGSSNVFAATPSDLGIKNIQSTQQKQTKVSQTVKSKKSNTVIGTISTINSGDFTIDIKNLKTKVISSTDAKVDASTVYYKDGVTSTISDLAVGQKVTVIGTLDKTTNIITAKQVKITTAVVKSSVVKKTTKKAATQKVTQ
jgi:hypothetical protein